MPWNERTRMDERMRFMAALSSCEYTMTELCEAYGISRKTGYKWAGRYLEEGLEGLKDRSRAPKGGRRTERRCVEVLLEARREHPRLGSAQAAEAAEAWSSGLALAGSQYGGRDPQAPWFGGAATSATQETWEACAADPGGGPERAVDGGFQGGVSAGESAMVLPVDGDGPAESVPAGL